MLKKKNDVSKHDSNHEKQIILLMIPNREVWHYLVVKKVSALLSGVTSKHYGDFYCLNCLHSFATEKNLNRIKKVCKNKDFCDIIMPSQDTIILEFDQYQKSDKAPFILCVGREFIIEKIYGC